MDERETILAGKIGLAISIILWLICTWRFGFHVCGEFFERPGDDEEGLGRRYSPLSHFARQHPENHDIAIPSIRWINRRRTFHGLLWIAFLCEIISYIDLSRILPFTSDRILAENIDCILLQGVGRTFELLSFYIVTEIWLRQTIDASPRIEARPRSMHETNQQYKWLTYIFVFLATILLLMTVATLWLFPHASNREYVLSTPLFMVQTLLEAICWGITAVMTAISIYMTSRCILVLVPSTEWKRRLNLLIKAVGPMLVSIFAYATRFGCLIAAYFNQQRRNSLAWWICFAWTPTTIVSIVLLYSIRKRDYHVADNLATTEENTQDSNDHDDSNGDLQQSLLRPQPPEEAFRAFHNFRRGEEDADDSFVLSSPIPHNVPKTVVSSPLPHNIPDTPCEESL